MKRPINPIRRAAVLLCGSALLAFPGAAWTAGAVSFTPAEVRQILAHGPWPPAAAPDRSNRVSGNPDAIALGERLFFSPRLSGTGGVLCASCHEPWRAFTDGRPRGLGLTVVDRNTPTLMNVRFNRWFGWDGSNDSLWAQSIRPLLEPREMDSSAGRIGALIRGDPFLSSAYEKAFGTKPPPNDEEVLAGVGKALAAYEETLTSGRTPFDDFRDAVAHGDARAEARLPAAAQRGLRVFLGKGGCESCHSGPSLADGDFHDTGVVSARQNGEVDSGRRDGVQKLLANRFNLLGPYNDDPSGATAARTRLVSAGEGAARAFRTPGLRNVVLTAPYMHDGSVATLCDAVRLHPARKAPLLTAQERNDLVAFLRTLTDAGPRLSDSSCR